MKKTPLNSVHHEMGAKMTDFGGWEMPVEYSGIIEEHKTVRRDAGLFDVSHMGEIAVRGRDAGSFIDYLVTNRVSTAAEGKVTYSPMCYPEGGIVDDLLVYKIQADEYFLVVNASNTDKDFAWISEQAAEYSGEVKVENQSQDYALLALQGPRSEEILSQLTSVSLDDIPAFNSSNIEVDGVNMLVSRTGYTGEDGFELYFAPGKAEQIWQSLLKAGERAGLKPAGLGARDTLRLEKCLCLYGNDISKDTNPLEAGLGWTVKFDKEDFVGKAALKRVKEAGASRKLVGFILQERGIARHNYPILSEEEEEIGYVTSGSYSPSLEENIGLGYVESSQAKPGQKIKIKIRSRLVAAEVVETPFI